MSWKISGDKVVVDAGFAQSFKALRKQNKLSQRQLAERAGVSVQSISRIERLKKEQTWNPKRDTLGYIAGVYDMTLDEFLSSLSEQRPSPPKRTAQEIPQGECEVVAAEIQATDIQVIQVLRAGSWWQRRPEIIRFSILTMAMAILFILAWPRLEEQFLTANWYFRKGVASYENKDYREAEACFLQARKKDRNLSTTDYYLGKIRLVEERFAEGISLLLKVPPRDANYLKAQQSILEVYIVDPEIYPVNAETFKDLSNIDIDLFTRNFLDHNPQDILGRLVRLRYLQENADPRLEGETRETLDILSTHRWGEFQYDIETGLYVRKFFPGNATVVTPIKIPTQDAFGFAPLLLLGCYVTLGYLELDRNPVFKAEIDESDTIYSICAENGLMLSENFAFVTTAQSKICTLIIDKGKPLVAWNIGRQFRVCYKEDFDIACQYFEKAVSIHLPVRKLKNQELRVDPSYQTPRGNLPKPENIALSLYTQASVRVGETTSKYRYYSLPFKSIDDEEFEIGYKRAILSKGYLGLPTEILECRKEFDEWLASTEAQDVIANQPTH